MHDTIRNLCRRLGFTKFDRLGKSGRAPDEEALFCLKQAIRVPYVILIYENLLIELTSDAFRFCAYYRPHGERPFDFLVEKDLNADSLRHVFTLLEILIHKIYHIKIKDLAHDYHFESQKRAREFEALRATLSEHAVRIYNQILYSRDLFAHTFVKTKDILYCGNILEDCFRKRDAIKAFGDADDVDIFTDDASVLINELATEFTELQFNQIDRHKFLSLVSEKAKGRSLTPY